MIIYVAYAFDGDYYDPLHDIGIYNDFEIAKKEAIKYWKKDTYGLHQLRVNTMELVDNEFKYTEHWVLDVFSGNDIWEEGKE